MGSSGNTTNAWPLEAPAIDSPVYISYRLAVKRHDQRGVSAAIRYGIPVQKHGIPVQKHGIPVQKYGMPVKKHGIRVQKHGMPVHSLRRRAEAVDV
jgi:hypothetical protein